MKKSFVVKKKIRKRINDENHSKNDFKMVSYMYIYTHTHTHTHIYIYIYIMMYIYIHQYDTLPTKVCIVKAMIFPVVMHGCENWTIKKAESHRIYAFKLWCWRRLLRAPWTARTSNQSILKVISPKYSLEGLMLKLKLQYFGHLMQRADSLGKTLMLEKIESKRRQGQTEDEMVGWHH